MLAKEKEKELSLWSHLAPAAGAFSLPQRYNLSPRGIQKRVRPRMDPCEQGLGQQSRIAGEDLTPGTSRVPSVRAVRWYFEGGHSS